MNEATAESTESAENAAVNNLTNPRRTALDVAKTGRLEYGSDDQLQRAALKTRHSAACPSSAGTRILLTSAVNF
jgi:hypothetical protein